MSRSLASFFRQVSLKEPSETSIKFKNKKCQNNLKNLNSSFDKTPGHFGSGFCSVKCSAHGGSRGRSDGSLVKCRCGLRVKCRFLRFARKIQSEITVIKCLLSFSRKYYPSSILPSAKSVSCSMLFRLMLTCSTFEPLIMCISGYPGCSAQFTD